MKSLLQFIAMFSRKRSQKIPLVDGLLLCTQIIETGIGLLNSTCNETVVITGNRENVDNTAVHVQTTMRRMSIMDPADADDVQGELKFIVIILRIN